MVYKHRHFFLDPQSRQVWDENGKSLRLTGNAYLMLEFLCKEKHGTVTDIGDVLDQMGKKRSKDETRAIMGYDENDLRQLKHRINSLIGYNVVKYQNHIYSIEGEIVQSEEKFVPTKPVISEKVEAGPKRKVWRRIIDNIKTDKRYIVLITGGVLIGIILLAIYLMKPSLVSGPKPEEDMILIPAGEFIMGSTEEEALTAYKLCAEEEGEYCIKEDYLAEYPQRRVYLKDFYIDRKEVSNEEYRMFVEATGHRPPLYWSSSNLNSPMQPVVGVSWDDAQDYCQWLGKRLPTEEEWERAARGTDGRQWPWGNDWDASKLNHGKGGRPGYDESDGYKYTAPVGVSLGVSPYGVLNMAGNIFEWVINEFEAYPGNDKFLHEDFGTPSKIQRGGSYIYGMADNRTAVRFYEEPDYKGEDVGFRCAK